MKRFVKKKITWKVFLDGHRNLSDAVGEVIGPSS